jgi:hypothetical protein
MPSRPNHVASYSPRSAPAVAARRDFLEPYCNRDEAVDGVIDPRAYMPDAARAGFRVPPS